MNPRMRCECGWEGTQDGMESVCVFTGSREEPPEYECTCPACNRPYDEVEEVPLCATCQDMYVQEDGDRCGGCLEVEEVEGGVK